MNPAEQKLSPTDRADCAAWAPCLTRLGLLLHFALLAVAPSSASADELSVQELLEYKTIRSRSRRFVAVAREGKQGLDLVKWTESVTGKLQRMTELKWPAVPWWSLTLSIRNMSGPESNRVFTIQGFDHGRFSQRLIINDYLSADVRETEEKLCHLLMNAAVVRAQLGTGDGALSPEGLRALRDSRQLHVAPVWLARGLSQNLHWRVRAANSRIAVARHARGDLPDLAEFFSEPEGQVAQSDPVMCGLAVGWLLSLPYERRVFPLLVQRLAEGDGISTGWLAAHVLGSAPNGNLDVAWETWLDRQKRTVYQPGETADHDLQLLVAALLLSAGRSGIPSENMPAGKLSMRGMIAYRNAPWIAAFVARKIAELRVLAVARGPELAQVVDHYCRFLAALRGGSGKQELQRMLGVAEAEQAALRLQLADGTADSGSGR
jgi:hypothetical protein